MKGKVDIREANLEDRKALWTWRNDQRAFQKTRKQKSNEYDQCRLWFERVFNSNDVILCIGFIETLRIGCVRFDRRENQQFEVSIFLKPAYCGKGLGYRLLEASIEYLCGKLRFRKVFARTPKGDLATRGILERAGFSLVEKRETELRWEWDFQMECNREEGS